MSKQLLEGLSLVQSWLLTDAQGGRILSTGANLLWRAHLFFMAGGGEFGISEWQAHPSKQVPEAWGEGLLLNGLSLFPGFCPRMLKAHVAAAEECQSKLRSSVLPLLQDALEKLTKLAQEIGDIERKGSRAVGEASLLCTLREALAVRMCTRVQSTAEVGAFELGSGFALEVSSLQEAAERWKTLAEEWESDALTASPEFSHLETSVWIATQGAASLATS